MDPELRDKFIQLWSKYFDGAELPICLFYSDDAKWAEQRHPAKGHRCMVGDLAVVCRGGTVALDKEAIGCFGGRRYLGFDQTIRPNFEYFLSCGIPGQMEGERYKKTPEIVREIMAKATPFTAPARFAVFKRWDKLEEAEQPEVVIFFAPPDVLSGLYTLAGFDQTESNTVIAPFGAGCSTIVQHPYLEKDRPNPRAFLGMFDVSARPCVPAGVLSFAVPMKKFVGMVDNMDQSFLITGSWAKVLRRIQKDSQKSE